MNRILQHLEGLVKDFFNIKLLIFNEPAVIYSNLCINISSIENSKNFLASLKDGFLWAVPKKRLTVEKRLLKKLGDDKWGPPAAKMLKPKKSLLICYTCGNYYEKGYLCVTCYKKVEEETKVIQEAMAKEYKMKKVDFEISVKYKSDNDKHFKESEKLKFIEIEKDRPIWFNKNLISTTHVTIPEKNVSIPEKHLQDLSSETKN